MMFLGGGVVLYLLVNWTILWLAGYWVKLPNEFFVNGIAALIALVVGVMAYRSDRLYVLASDVAAELKKVTWPTRKETQVATLVVLVTVVLASMILGAFDMVWSFLTDKVYG